MTTLDLATEIALHTTKRGAIIESLGGLASNRVMLLDALDRLAANEGELRALRMVERQPPADRRTTCVRLLCELAQKAPAEGNEQIAAAAERGMYAVLIERSLV